MIKSRSLLLFAALLLAGCVNVHVHFPEATPGATPTTATPAAEEEKKK